jgi:hypothetical protein
MAACLEIIGGASFVYVLHFPCGLLFGITALGPSCCYWRCGAPSDRTACFLLA